MNQWLQILGLVGIGGVLVATINGLFSKRKLSADATKIITEAASSVVADLRTELARRAAENVLLEGRVAATVIEQSTQRDHMRSLDQAVAQHVLWDQQVRETLRESGIDVPAPPPLPGPVG